MRHRLTLRDGEKKKIAIPRIKNDGKPREKRITGKASGQMDNE